MLFEQKLLDDKAVTEVMTARPSWFWHDGIVPEDKVMVKSATPPSGNSSAHNYTICYCIRVF